MKFTYKEPTLVICDGIGDLQYLEPAIRLFKELNPKVSLYLMTWDKPFSELHQLNPNLAGVIPIAGSLQQQIAVSQQHGFDSNVVICDNIAGLVSGCPKCGGADINWWWRRMSYFHLHLAEGYCLNLNGIVSANIRPQKHVNDNDNKYGDSLKDFQPYVFMTLSTRTDNTRKEWPLERFYILMNLILAKFPKLNIVTVGGSNDPIIPFENEYNKRVKNLRDLNIREVYRVAENSCYTITLQNGISAMLDTMDNPGCMLNIGSDKSISGRLSPHCKIVNQKELFGPLTISVDDVWEVINNDLNNICN